MRLADDPVEADRLIAATHSFNASDALPHIECPTVVLHRRDLHWLDIGLSRDVASRIPGARLTIVDGYSRLPAAGETSPVTTAIAEILGLAPAEPKPERNSGDFRVVLFTDLVDHTHMMSDLGDGRGRELLREHETITREVLREHGGTELKTLGDGFMASFTRITEALGCAVNLQQRFTRRNARVASFDEPPLKVRIGINAGEPIEGDGDLFGATVILAVRIASAAQGDEVLVSNAVRELSAGNDFIFRNRGSFDAKGFDEPVQIWEVAWTP